MSNQIAAPPAHDDADQVQAAQRGDVAAFEFLVRTHQKAMLNVAYRLTGVYEDACDVVQDAFLIAWRKLGDFRSEARFSTWLTSIVINQSRNRLKQMRQQERRHAHSLDAPIAGHDDPPSATTDGTPSVLELLEEVELRRALQRCIEALTPEFREVLVLRDMREMSYEDVGASLNLREGTVKSRLFRARDAVKNCLKRAVVTT